ncbi:MAG: SEL1-like repeat protein [Candidatus Riflebacteria bacterium]|nr:SEL1-like repeat protein [Candidatus Riflebacteria bacterium]
MDDRHGLCETCGTHLDIRPDGCEPGRCPTCGSPPPSGGVDAAALITESATDSAGLTPPAQVTTPFSAEFLSSFRLVKLLGRGGMGSVYLMRQQRLDRLVAVKVVRGEDVAPSQVQRLLKEARILASLSHPNIVTVHDVGEDGTTPYVVFEYVDGISLARRMGSAPALTLPESLDLVVGILDGLETAHRQGIIHRDLKPDNVFLTPRGIPKIGDFGLARSKGLPAGSSVGRVLGTPPYMSPEQCRGEDTSPASDVYAVGVILFELVTSKLPFPGPSLAEFLFQHVSRPPPSVNQIRPGLPEALDKILERALAKEPSSRFGGAGPFREALQALKSALLPSETVQVPSAGPDLRPVSAPPSQPVAPVAAPCPSSDRPEEVVTARPRSPRRWAGAIVVALVIGLAWLWHTRRLELWLRLATANQGDEFRAIADMYTDGAPIRDRTKALFWLTRAAGAGHGSSQERLAEAYRHGNGTPKDPVQAAVWYKKAAEGGSVTAQRILGTMFSEGAGVPRDPAQAVRWFERAAESGDVEAARLLADALLAGQGIPGNHPEALKWYRFVFDRRLATANLGEIARRIGWLHEAGKGVTHDPGEALAWYRRAAELGSADGTYCVGVCYDVGIGVAKDQNQALYWYRRAAEKGLSRAIWAVGLCYEHGRGVTQDPVQAFTWYRRAAERGDVRGQHNLGLCFENGIGVARDEKEAVRWYRKAVDQGDTTAMASLAQCYDTGVGVTVDPAEAAQLRQRAGIGAGTAAAGSGDPGKAALEVLNTVAENFDVIAETTMGVCHETGQGVPRDLAAAVRYYRSAALKGYSEAQNRLGECYQLGKGVPLDLSEALQWYRRAAAQNHADALNKVAMFLLLGWAGKADPPGAVALFRRSAALGLGAAQYNLGVCLQEGRGVPVDLAGAANWFSKSARQGHPQAQYRYALCLDEGLGLARNAPEALQWFRQAAGGGIKEAQELLRKRGSGW